MVKRGEGRCSCISAHVPVFFLLIIPIFDLVLHFFVSSHSYTLDSFRFAIFFLSLFSLRSSSILSRFTFTGDVEVAFFLRGAHGVSGLWPSPPAITQPHHVTSVDRCSCCRQTNHHSTFGLVSLLCPSLRSLWTLISTLGPLQR